jgi:hypothetical protein
MIGLDVCRYYRLRNAIIGYAVIGMFLAIAIGSIVFWTIEFVSFFRGEDAWPSGLFLSALILYCLSVAWRYSSQQAEDRRRQRDEEDRRTVYYS